MARILVADYGREDLLTPDSPLATMLRAWGHAVVEAADPRAVLQQVLQAPPEVVLLYDTLPDLESLRSVLQQPGETLGLPVLIVPEKIQHMQFTDMIVVDPRYHLGKSRRQFDADVVGHLLEQAGVQPVLRAPGPSA